LDARTEFVFYRECHFMTNKSSGNYTGGVFFYEIRSKINLTDIHFVTKKPIKVVIIIIDICNLMYNNSFSLYCTPAMLVR